MLYLLITIFLSHSSFASSTIYSCYLNEPFPNENRRFSSQEEYQFMLQNWNQRMPEEPTALELLWGWAIARDASQFARQNFSNDKKMHCYVGCEVAQKSNYRTAVYAGWYKEYQDLTDCKSNSGFSPDDFEATLAGARIGLAHYNNCLSLCHR